MDESEARRILGGAIQGDDSLYDLDWYIAESYDQIYLDWKFSVEDLEAIVWWMRNRQK